MGAPEYQAKAGAPHLAGRQVARTPIQPSQEKGQKLERKLLLQGRLQANEATYSGGHTRKRREIQIMWTEKAGPY